MDQHSEQRLAKLLKEDISTLLEDDLAFLRARRSYITDKKLIAALESEKKPRKSK